jgi:hypothetical protein
MDSSPRCLKKEKSLLKLDCQGIAFGALPTGGPSIVKLGVVKKQLLLALARVTSNSHSSLLKPNHNYIWAKSFFQRRDFGKLQYLYLLIMNFPRANF